MRRAAALLLAFAAGCATVLDPGPDYVPVSTKPPGARVFLDGAFLGPSPLVARLGRECKGVFRIEMEGYEPRMIDRNKRFNPASLFNALFVLPIPGFPFICDAMEGNIGKYSGEPLRVELSPLEGP